MDVISSWGITTLTSDIDARTAVYDLGWNTVPPNNLKQKTLTTPAVIVVVMDIIDQGMKHKEFIVDRDSRCIVR